MRVPLLIVLVALVSFGGGCQTNQATGRLQFATMSAEQEIALAEGAMPELIQQYGGEVSSNQVKAYVNKVGQRLLANVESDYADLPWEFTVLNSDVINAFALPAGKVFITTGLLRECTNEAQVAGVLGHEIGHVTAEHVDERITKATGLQVLVAGVGLVSNSEMITIGANLVSNGYQLQFGRSQESESDVLGVRYMSAAGYDPYGMMEVLFILQRASEGNRQPEFLSTHPHPETRMETVQGLLEGDYKDTQGNPEYKKYKRPFEQDLLPHLAAMPRPTDDPVTLALLAQADMCGCGGCGTE